MASDSAKRDFVMGFVAHSEKWRSQFVDKWQEVIANFIVEPSYITSSVKTPYSSNKIYRQSPHQVLLKDPETHKIVMTYAAKLVRVLFGDPRGEYVSGEPVGYEDVKKAQSVTRLERYVFGKQGHFRTMVEGVVDSILVGTAVIESPWRYEERHTLARSVESAYGVETDSFSNVSLPYYDDVCLRGIDVMDFFPDPSRYRIYEMAGVAKRFRMTAAQARRSPVYDRAKVEEAARTTSGSSDRNSGSYTNFREGLDQPIQNTAMSDFKDMVGYEYWGETDWGRRVITVLNNVVVRDIDYPYADPTLPFHALIINPVQGRFYGVSPAEVIRYDQSFADAIKMLLAEAIIRQVHPPIAYDSDSDFDVAKLRAWKADIPIGIRGGPNAIGTLRYDANVLNGFNMLSGLKMSMQEGSGATGGIQGQEGPDREAATVGAARLQFAMDRPELAAMIYETECLPEIGLAVLRRCQQFLDSDGLKQRIGEMPDPVWIGDIMGDFDIRFVGSRKATSRQQKLQGLDRLVGLGSAIPEFRMSVPWADLAQDVIGNWMELPEIAIKIGTPETIMQNAQLSQLNSAVGGGAGGAAQNGVAASPEPVGMLPAQAAGGIS